MTSNELKDLLDKHYLTPKTVARLIGAREHTVRFYLSGTLPIPDKRARQMRSLIPKVRTASRF